MRLDRGLEVNLWFNDAMYGIDAGEGLKWHWLLAVNVRFALRPGSETRFKLVKAKSLSRQSVATCRCNIAEEKSLFVEIMTGNLYIQIRELHIFRKAAPAQRVHNHGLAVLLNS